MKTIRWILTNRRSNPLPAAFSILAICLLAVSCTSGERTKLTPESLVESIEATKPVKESVSNLPTLAPKTALTIPSPSATASLAATSGATPRPSATAVCKDDLRFLEDLTIPDGSQIQAADPIDKRWLVENNGTCNWGAEYRLRLIEGPGLGAATELALYPALSGTQAILRILFQAPTGSGAYRSAWQAHSPNGQPFGEIIYIDIQVIE
ncbi:NBR1-Ig-like domain-containing protein [Chloroflexota bacterium]